MMSELLALLIRESRIVAVDLTTGATRTVTDAAGPSPDGLVVVDGTVYWTTMGRPTVDPKSPGEAGRDYSAPNGGLHAVGLDGQGLRDLLPAGALTTGKQLATDGDRLYWGDREGCRISTCRLDGTGLTDLLVNPCTSDQLNECVGVAVDSLDGRLYWSQKGPAKGGVGRIFSAKLADSAEPRPPTEVRTLWADLPEPIDLELVGDHLYWTDRGAAPLGNTLNRALLPATEDDPVGSPEILASGFREAIGLAVDEVAGVAYVSDLAGDIRSVPLPGRGGVEHVVARLGTPVTGIALI